MFSVCFFVFVKREAAYEMRISDWSSGVGSSDRLASPDGADGSLAIRQQAWLHGVRLGEGESASFALKADRRYWLHLAQGAAEVDGRALSAGDAIGYVDESGELLVEGVADNAVADRSEEQTSELQSLMRISSAGFCLKNK